MKNVARDFCCMTNRLCRGAVTTVSISQLLCYATWQHWPASCPFSGWWIWLNKYSGLSYQATRAIFKQVSWVLAAEDSRSTCYSSGFVVCPGLTAALPRLLPALDWCSYSPFQSHTCTLGCSLQYRYHHRFYPNRRSFKMTYEGNGRSIKLFKFSLWFIRINFQRLFIGTIAKENLEELLRRITYSNFYYFMSKVQLLISTVLSTFSTHCGFTPVKPMVIYAQREY